MGQARDKQDATVREGAVSQARPELSRPRSPGISRVTLQDVADRAGVSLTTASRVVNEGSRRVGPRLAERVNQAVTELGYTANLQAREIGRAHV